MTSEGGHQDTYDCSEGVKSFSRQDGRDSAFNNCSQGSPSVKGLWESGKEKASLKLNNSSCKDM